MPRNSMAIVACFLALAAFPLMELRGIDRAKLQPFPEDGSLSLNIYQNAYFGFAYPVPPNWVEDVKGPPPSASGYYSLLALKPRDSLAATLLIAAQDNFFAGQPVKGAADFLGQLKRQLDPAISKELPLPVKIAGQSFARLDYAGAGLHHALLATEIRCHTVIFSITSRSSDQIESVVASLNHITFTGDESGWPLCLREYATADHIVHRVEPAAAGPRFSSVPARIVIGANGRVAEVHPIGGLPEQRKSIQDALSEWEFRPCLLNGKRVAVETGLIVQFSAER